MRKCKLTYWRAIFPVIVCALSLTGYAEQPADHDSAAHTPQTRQQSHKKHVAKRMSPAELASNSEAHRRVVRLQKYERRGKTMQWNEIGDKLRSKDQLTRRAAAYKLANDDPEKQDSKQLIKFIAMALGSSDSQVRTYGSDAAYRASGIHKPRLARRQGSSTPYDLSRNPNILPRLISIIKTGTSTEAKSSSIATLYLNYDAIDRLRPLLVEQYNKSHSKEIKAELMSLMARWDFRSDDVVSIMIKALQSTTPYLQATAADALGTLRADKGVEPLVTTYIIAPTAVKGNIERALKKYQQTNGNKDTQYKKVANSVERLDKIMHGHNVTFLIQGNNSKTE